MLLCEPRWLTRQGEAKRGLAKKPTPICQMLANAISTSNGVCSFRFTARMGVYLDIDPLLMVSGFELVAID